MNTWTIVLGLATAFFGGSWLTQFVKNKGDFGIKQVEELAAYRAELRAEIKDQKEDHDKQIAELKEASHKEISELKKLLGEQISELRQELKLKEERLQKAEEKLKRVEKEQIESDMDREHFEHRVLNIIEFKWSDREAVNELAADIRERHVERRRTRRRSRLEGRKRILIVDDTRDIASMFKLALVEDGYDCAIATNGRDALQEFSEAHASHTPFDLVLMDSLMPDMEGAECARRIRSLEAQRGDGSHVLLSFLTADKDSLAITLVQEVDAVDVWGKPLLPEDLKSKIKVLWN